MVNFIKKYIVFSLLFFLFSSVLVGIVFVNALPAGSSTSIYKNPESAQTILIIFNQGVQYSQAQALFAKLGVENKVTNDYWAANNFVPTPTTILGEGDIFAVYAEAGQAETIETELKKSGLVATTIRQNPSLGL